MQQTNCELFVNIFKSHPIYGVISIIISSQFYKSSKFFHTCRMMLVENIMRKYHPAEVWSPLPDTYNKRSTCYRIFICCCCFELLWFCSLVDSGANSQCLLTEHWPKRMDFICQTVNEFTVVGVGARDLSA